MAVQLKEDYFQRVRGDQEQIRASTRDMVPEMVLFLLPQKDCRDLQAKNKYWKKDGGASCLSQMSPGDSILRILSPNIVPTSQLNP